MPERFPTPLPLVLLGVLILAACSSSDDSVPNTVDNGADTDTDGGFTPDPDMVFFLTSSGPGDGGNLGGLAGADVHCTTLANAAGASADRTWRAYLSTTGADGVNAIDRIGEGPWFNADGVQIASSVQDLLSDDNNLNRETAISELGEQINGIGDQPNRHDILTGTELDGLASTETTGDTTCANWTSNDMGNALVGHHDRDGGGQNPTSWSTAHGTNGCSQADLQSTGGDGLFYCFANN